MQQIKNNNYDLAERTSKFSENIIDLCHGLKTDNVSKPIVMQLVRSATSIGANYMEARNGSSRKDFRNKIYLCKKEAQETEYWLRLLLKCFISKKVEISKLSSEVHELLLIFQKIVSTMQIVKLET